MDTHDINHEDEEAAMSSCEQNRETLEPAEGQMNPPDFRREKERLESFPADSERGTWPGKEELAKNGFYYNFRKIISCVFCTMTIIAPWVKGETVKDVHDKNGVICPFMEKKFVGNVPLESENQEEAEDNDGTTEDVDDLGVNVGPTPKHPSLRSIRERLSTFLGTWPLFLRQTAPRLASAGFYFLKRDAVGWHIGCYLCGRQAIIKKNTMKLTPWQIHRTISPSCPLVMLRQALQLPSTPVMRDEPFNWPADDADQEEVQEHEMVNENYDGICQSVGMRGNAEMIANTFHNSTRAGSSFMNTNRVADVKSFPQFPFYVDKQPRLESFDTDWIHMLRTFVLSMVKSGFFYTGRGDIVQCFGCGVEIYNWRLYHHVPDRQHALFSPQCPFLLKRKGKKFVVDVLKKAPRKIVMMDNKILN